MSAPINHSHLVLGGARSGKSSHAEGLAYDIYTQTCGGNESKLLTYIATATAGDKEMTERIAHHKARRDNSWSTIEEPIKLAKVLDSLAPDSVVLIDCLTLWLSNCLHQDCWEAEKAAFYSSLRNSDSTIIMVSNEVGSGIVPMGQLSRSFVDESGWLNQQLGEICDHVSLIVAGLPVSLK